MLVVEKGYICFILLLFYLCIPQSFFGQEKTTGHLSGVIRNGSGELLPTASIQLKGTSFATISTEKGAFEITGIPAGKYTIIISHIGYETYSAGITITDRKHTCLDTIILKSIPQKLQDVIITATKTKKNITDVAVPVTLVGKDEITDMASPRLDEILSEQTGMTITSSEGVQVQGFDHQYTLIMINGDPVIGRLKGADYLNRITVNNIKQVEIIKGPSSSLYGNEAIAGVINIITEEGADRLAASVEAMARSHNTFDLNANINMKWKRSGFGFNLNNYSSDGYDLDPENNLQTVPDFFSTTVSGHYYYHITDKIKVSANAKYFNDRQDNKDVTTIGSDDYDINTERKQQEWNGVLQMDYTFNSKAHVELKNYTTNFSRFTDYRFASGDSLQDHTFTDHLYNKTEGQYNQKINKANEIVAGIGYITETIESSSYNGKYTINAKYIYGQHEWTPWNRKLNITTGIRYDIPSDYASKASPKLAVRYELTHWLTLNGFAGTGFRAPDFKHLFLDYLNPTSGFRIMGASIMKESLAALENAGMIDELYYDYNTWEPLKPESSVSFNLGFEVALFKSLSLKTNVFRNDLKDMIGTTIIGTSNGSNIYVYENIESVFTQGLESNMSITVFERQLMLSAGYQYMEAKDKQVIENIKDEKIYTTEPETKKMDMSEYGGLFNRSRHSGTFKIFYKNKKYKFNTNLRIVYKGRYGEGDINGNGILDIEDEYTPGYFLWYAGISKRIMNSFVIKMGVDNIFDFTNLNRTRIPGRIIYFGIIYEINKN